MKAAVLKGPLAVRVEDVPAPKAGPGEVVIKVKYCGICGSELHYYESGNPADTILGHEFVGTVHEMGEGAEAFSPGQRVTSMPFDPPCGTCFWCARGEMHLCPALMEGVVGTKPGAFAEFVKRDARTVIPLPDSLPDKAAPLIEPLAVCLHALKISGMMVGDRVAVLGCGPIGLLTIRAASLGGAGRIFATDKVAARLALAREMGAYEPFSPDEQNVTERVRQGTGGIGVDIVFDCVGIPETIQTAQWITRKGGQIVVLGIHLGEATLSPLMFVANEITLKGSMGYYHEFFTAMELIEKGEVPYEALITDIIPMAGIDEACKRLLHPETDVKILVDPESKEERPWHK